MPAPVTDNAAAHRFELAAEGGTAFADYRRKDGVVTILHTEVPPALAGKGLGSALAGGALALIRARGEKVASRCSFMTSYLKKHPEHADLLAQA